jgi:hypothetical protein
MRLQWWRIGYAPYLQFMDDPLLQDESGKVWRHIYRRLWWRVR